MPNFVPVSRESHGGKRLLRPFSYAFASPAILFDILLPEITRAAVEFPLVFVMRDAGPQLYALMSMYSNKNLFVTPEGRWIARYMPATLRAYPFGIAKPAGAPPVLGIDEECPQLSASAGDPLFEDGRPAPLLQSAVELLKRIETETPAMIAACQALQERELLIPWVLEAKPGETRRPVDGLLRIDEAKFESLDEESFLKLRAVGAIRLAHLHLASLHNLHRMNELDMAHQLGAKYAQAKAAEKPPALIQAMIEELELKF
ncbi:MAG: SapC family protein [Alphaproteobacteria bacterium]|nr:SapC family protein [Alphaproteobacteria bacterium]